MELVLEVSRQVLNTKYMGLKDIEMFSVFLHLGVNIAYVDIKMWPVLLCLNLYKSRPNLVEPVTDLQ